MVCLNALKIYLSNPSIVWDNTGRYIQWQNGARFINDFGYNVAYSIVNDTLKNRDTEVGISIFLCM